MHTLDSVDYFFSGDHGDEVYSIQPTLFERNFEKIEIIFLGEASN
jgi:hypothetical protein